MSQGDPKPQLATAEPSAAPGHRGGWGLLRAAGWAVSWLLHRPACQYLTLTDAELARQAPGRFERGWLDLMGLSLLWGLASMGIYAACWGVFGDFTGIPLVPAAGVLAAGLLWPYRRALVGLSQLLGRDRPDETAASAAVLVAGAALLLLGLRSWNMDVPYNWYLSLVRPPTLFRVLLLAPLWGAWSMLVTCQLRWGVRPSEPVTARLARSGGMLAAPAVLGALLLLTIVYFNHLPWTQLSIAATGAAGGVLAGAATTRLERALSRRALLSANLLTQGAFLLAYLANR